jgi:hypothetical protein
MVTRVKKFLFALSPVPLNLYPVECDSLFHRGQGRLTGVIKNLLSFFILLTSVFLATP